MLSLILAYEGSPSDKEFILQMYLQNRRLIYACAVKFSSPEEAEDIAQEAMIRLMERIDTLRKQHIPTGAQSRRKLKELDGSSARPVLLPYAILTKMNIPVFMHGSKSTKSRPKLSPFFTPRYTFCYTFCILGHFLNLSRFIQLTRKSSEK